MGGVPDLPERVGPYRLSRRLGAGGMGEVFEALDERLGRRVAVKRIRGGAGTGGDGRERFRREARAAASLNHPGIVQIYDVVGQEEVDFIVMEYVDGTSLAGRLAAGPLPAARVARLGRELAQALAHAHERRVIHRDLKPENVLLTPSGEAKIADFGIAKRREAEAEAEDLTRSRAVVGTVRSMSPEQARGEEVDHRSDLFSLGVLLYEAATGKNPFAAENTLAVLRRIIDDEPEPAAALAPDLPPQLGDLLHRLLAKPRQLRPQSAAEVAGELAAIEAGLTGGETLVDGGAATSPPTAGDGRTTGTRWRSRRRWAAGLAGLIAVPALIAGLRLAHRPPPEPLSVAVPLPRTAGAPGVASDLLPSGVRFAVINALLSLSGVSVVATDEVDAAGDAPVDLARITSADEVLASELECRGRRCWITLSRLTDQGRRVAWTERLEAPADDVYVASQAVIGFLRQGFPDRPPRPEVAPLEVRPRDYEEFLRLERSFRQKSEGLDTAVLLERLAEIRRGSPRFLDGYLLAAEILRLSFLESRQAADRDRAFELLDEARELAPDHPRPLDFLFHLHLAAGRLEEAAVDLARLETVAPGASQTAALRAQLLEARGAGEEAVDEMRRATARRPSVANLSNLAVLEFNLGHVEASRDHLVEALEAAPDDFKLASQLAMVELMAGDPARAAELYTELVERRAGFTELSNLGLALLLEGEFAAALERFQQAWSLAPNNVFAMLNLADAQWLAGEREQAEALYRRLLQAMERDPAASTWQFQTVRAQALAHLERSAEARAAVAAAQRLAPDNPQVAYESALVYAAIGDLAAARVQAERALRLGYDRRWFTFPWFDPLRESPGFRRLLASGDGAG